jgi:hypothetical protein
MFNAFAKAIISITPDKFSRLKILKMPAVLPVNPNP